MKIAFIGNFAPKKGSRLFTSIVQQLGSKHEWYIFGNIGDDSSYLEIQSYVKESLSYEEGELEEVLRHYRIELGMLLSIWPETFSKTFFELVSYEFPFLATEIGFPPTIFPEYPLFIQYHDIDDAAKQIIQQIQELNIGKLDDARKKIRQFKQNQSEHFAKCSLIKWELMRNHS